MKKERLEAEKLHSGTISLEISNAVKTKVSNGIANVVKYLIKNY
jgi:hypothetical protein